MTFTSSESKPDAPPDSADSPRHLVRVTAGFSLLALVLFGDLLLCASDGRIASSGVGDTVRYFSFMRSFAAAELASGNVPLWNPHSFSGNPFVGVFQSAVFYPPNLIYVVLPIDRALNLDFVLHVVLLGTLTFVWIRGHRLHGFACFFGAMVVVLGATFFLRVLAGQLSMLATLAWWPLVLASIDQLAKRCSLGWTLAGVAAVTLMLLGGHPPTALMCAVMTAAYCAVKLISCVRRAAFVLALVPIVVAPLFLSAIQLWTGLDAAMQGIRSSGMDFAFATSFSLPPESLLTFLAPEMMGNAAVATYTYYGRWFYWDASVYMGACALLLAVHGAHAGRVSLRRRWLGLAALGLVLALGSYTPIYGWIYAGVPGFDLLRAPSKFAFHASLFGAGLAALGVDRLLHDRTGVRITAGVAAAFAGIVALLAIWVWAVPPGEPGAASLIERLASLNERRSLSPGQVAEWQKLLIASLPRQFFLFAVSAVLLWLAQRRAWAVSLLLVVALLDLTAFAHRNRGGTHLFMEYIRREGLADAYERAGEDRVLLDGRTSNIAIGSRAFDIWGYEPIVLDRYARFMAFTQGRSVEDLNNVDGDHPDRFHRLFRMLRGRLSVTRRGGVREHPGAWSRFHWAKRYRVVEDLDAALAALADPKLDLESELILEAPPEIEPATREGAASIERIAESTDRLELAVRLEAPAILVITDAWARGWRAFSVVDGERVEHAVVPANAVLRAIALPAGTRRLTLEYAPAIWRPAVITSSVSGGVFFVLVGYRLRSGLRRRRAGAGTSSSS